MALTVAQIKNAKPIEKAYKLADEHGLYVLITPNGSKLWTAEIETLASEQSASSWTAPTPFNVTPKPKE